MSLVGTPSERLKQILNFWKEKRHNWRRPTTYIKNFEHAFRLHTIRDLAVNPEGALRQLFPEKVEFRCAPGSVKWDLTHERGYIAHCSWPGHSQWILTARPCKQDAINSVALQALKIILGPDFEAYNRISSSSNYIGIGQDTLRAALTPDLHVPNPHHNDSNNGKRSYQGPSGTSAPTRPLNKSSDSRKYQLQPSDCISFLRVQPDAIDLLEMGNTEDIPGYRTDTATTVEEIPDDTQVSSTSDQGESTGNTHETDSIKSSSSKLPEPVRNSNTFFDSNILEWDPIKWKTLAKSKREDILFDFWKRTSRHKFPATFKLFGLRNATSTASHDAVIRLFSNGHYPIAKDIRAHITWTTLKNKRPFKVQVIWGQNNSTVEGTGATLQDAQNAAARKILLAILGRKDLKILEHISRPFFVEGSSTTQVNLEELRVRLDKYFSSITQQQAQQTLSETQLWNNTSPGTKKASSLAQAASSEGKEQPIQVICTTSGGKFSGNHHSWGPATSNPDPGSMKQLLSDKQSLAAHHFSPPDTSGMEPLVASKTLEAGEGTVRDKDKSREANLSATTAPTIIDSSVTTGSTRIDSPITTVSSTIDILLATGSTRADDSPIKTVSTKAKTCLVNIASADTTFFARTVAKGTTSPAITTPPKTASPITTPSKTSSPAINTPPETISPVTTASTNPDFPTKTAAAATSPAEAKSVKSSTTTTSTNMTCAGTNPSTKTIFGGRTASVRTTSAATTDSAKAITISTVTTVDSATTAQSTTTSPKKTPVALKTIVAATTASSKTNSVATTGSTNTKSEATVALTKTNTVATTPSTKANFVKTTASRNTNSVSKTASTNTNSVATTASTKSTSATAAASTQTISPTTAATKTSSTATTASTKTTSAAATITTTHTTSVATSIAPENTSSPAITVSDPCLASSCSLANQLVIRNATSPATMASKGTISQSATEPASLEKITSNACLFETMQDSSQSPICESISPLSSEPSRSPPISTPSLTTEGISPRAQPAPLPPPQQHAVSPADRGNATSAETSTPSTPENSNSLRLEAEETISIGSLPFMVRPHSPDSALQLLLQTDPDESDPFFEYFSHSENGSTPHWFSKHYPGNIREKADICGDLRPSKEDVTGTWDQEDLPYLPFDEIIGYVFPEEAVTALGLLFANRRKETGAQYDTTKLILAECHVGSQVFRALGATEEEAKELAAAEALKVLTEQSD